MSTVYAYPTLVGKIEVTVRGASMDGKPLQLSLISQRDQVVALHQIERNDWIEGVLDMEVSSPPMNWTRGRGPGSLASPY